ncbi:MAG: ATP-binding cassette domain-containing protein [Thermomicrobiales bacterium]|nr:ATP-binding cassette domain-containing protein [Thermomicrobiales bacterium]
MYAVNGVQIKIAPGEAAGLVGECGSGKSAIAKCPVKFLEPARG